MSATRVAATRTLRVPRAANFGDLATKAGNPRVEIAQTHQELPPNRLRLPFVSDVYAEMAASFRSLRHKLQAIEGVRVIAITSPHKSEGKTTCAVNLAMAFAEHGTSVLLVEGSWQRPAIATGLGFTPPTCFARQVEALSARQVGPGGDGNDFRWRATAAYFLNLHVLAVDPKLTEPALLSGAAFAIALTSLRDSPYECIIVDGPSVFESADMNIIEDSVDGVVFAVKSGSTRGRDLERAKEQLEPVNVLGSVLMNR